MIPNLPSEEYSFKKKQKKKLVDSDENGQNGVSGT